MGKDFMADMIRDREDYLVEGMTVVEWFDPSKSEHMDAYKVLRETGQWPQGFIPDDLEFPGTWAILLNEKVTGHLLEAPQAPGSGDPMPEPEGEENPEDEEEPLVPAEEEPSADVDLEKIYLGQAGDTHLYVVADKNEAGVTEDLQVTDQEGNTLVSAKETGLEIGDVSAFILGAIENEALKGAQLERSVVMQYLVPQVEAELEEPEDEFDAEGGGGDESLPDEEEEEKPMPRESKVHESKGVSGMLIEDQKGNSFSVEVLDEGGADETIVAINGREFHFQGAMVKAFAEGPELTDESIKELALQTLSHLEESDYAELVGMGVQEGVDARGQRDGTGPFRGSARAGKPGMRKAAGRPCPMAEEEELVDAPGAEIPGGEATIPSGEGEIPGGEAENSGPIEVEPSEVQMGMAHELEHTDDPKIALEIALDHLTENPAYYTELEANMGDNPAGAPPEDEDAGDYTQENEGKVPQDSDPEDKKIKLLVEKEPTEEGKVPQDSDPEDKKIKQLLEGQVTEGILELVGEVDWMTPEDAEAVRAAVEDGRLESEWPPDEEMIDALSGLEDVVDPANEPGDVRMAYLRHIIVPKAISTSDVTDDGTSMAEGSNELVNDIRMYQKKYKLGSWDEAVRKYAGMNGLKHEDVLAALDGVDVQEGEYSDMAGQSSFKTVFQVDYVTDTGENKSTRVMAHDDTEAEGMLTNQKGVKSVLKVKEIAEEAEEPVAEGSDPDEKVDQDIADLAAESEEEVTEEEDAESDEDKKARQTAESLLGLSQPQDDNVDEAVVGDTVQIVQRTDFEMMVEQTVIRQVDEKLGVEITGNTIPSRQQWYSLDHYQIIKL